jgi:predicted RNA-binding protein with PUA-like domain
MAIYRKPGIPLKQFILQIYLPVGGKLQISKLEFVMAYWLVKSEPFKYSWEQFEKDGKTFWDGVRNYAARNHLKTMKKGDQVLWYHSNEGLEIVGIAKVAKEAYQDPTTEEEAWVAVDLKPYKKLKKPVSLAQVKTEKRLKNMALVRLGRLSVQPVTDDEWKVVMELAETKA